MTDPRDANVVIEEMIDHIDYILAKTRNLSSTTFHDDRDVRQSVERSLEIISEASRHLTDELKSSTRKFRG